MSTETSKIKTAFMIFVCIIMQSTVYGIMPFQNIYKRNLASDTIIDTAQDKPAINPTHKIALSFSKQIFKPLFLNDDTSTLEGLVGTDLSNFFDLDSTISSYLNSDSSPIDQYDDISEPSYDGLSDAIRQKIRNLIGATSAIKENAYATNVYYDRDRLCLIFDVYVKIIMDRRININSSKILCDFKGPIVSNNIELTFRLEYSLYFYLADYFNDPETYSIKEKDIVFNLKGCSLDGKFLDKEQFSLNKIYLGPFELISESEYGDNFMLGSQWQLETSMIALNSLNAKIWINNNYGSLYGVRQLKTSEKDSISTATVNFYNNNVWTRSLSLSQNSFSGFLSYDSIPISNFLTLYNVRLEYKPSDSLTKKCSRLNVSSCNALIKGSGKINGQALHVFDEDDHPDTISAVNGWYDLRKKSWTLIFDKLSLTNSGYFQLFLLGNRIEIQPEKKQLLFDTLFYVIPQDGDTVKICDTNNHNLVKLKNDGVYVNPSLDSLLLHLKRSPESYPISMNGLLIRKYNDGSISKPISPHVLGGVTDIDGNRYRTIIIGTQEWTIDNLRTSRFTDGTLIPIVKDDFKWAGMKTPAYCFYNNSNDSNFIVRQGALYNGLCISGDKNLAPKGWRIPSRRDWDILWEYMVFHGYNWDGRCKGNKYAKAIADSIMWISSPECQLGNVGKEIGDNNSSGFSALPCGRRNDFTFDDFGKSAYFWSSTMEAIKIENIRDDVDCIMVTGSQGYSVRIVRDIDSLLCK